MTKAVYQAATGLLDVAEGRAFRERFLAGPDLVPVAGPSGPGFTTASLLAEEQRIAAAAVAKLRTPTPAPTSDMVEQAAADVGAAAGFRFSEEQLAALRFLCGAVGWASLEGRAGSGKTSVVRAVVRAYHANRQPVVVVATAAETARRTAEQVGLDRGYTIEAFTHAVRSGRLRPQAGWVVIVEEAVMVDTHRMARLLQAAGPASIRTLGDPEQAQAVGPGGWHGQIDRLISGHAELTTVVRQRDQADRAACRAIRDGRAADALANLHSRGRVHLTSGPEQAMKEIVHAWDQHRRNLGPEGVKILTDTDNRTVDTLNALCQARRLAVGELRGPVIEILDRVTGRRERLHVGDQVRFIRPYHAGATHILNGTSGTVTAVDLDRQQVTVACDHGQTVTLRPGGLVDAQPLRLGYAGHVLKLQGGQAGVVLLLPGSWQTSRQSAYSMATRCAEQVHVFIDRQTQCTGPYLDWDPISALADRWTRDARKLAATARLGLLAEPHDAYVSDLSAPEQGVRGCVQPASEPAVRCTEMDTDRQPLASPSSPLSRWQDWSRDQGLGYDLD